LFFFYCLGTIHIRKICTIIVSKGNSQTERFVMEDETGGGEFIGRGKVSGRWASCRLRRSGRPGRTRGTACGGGRLSLLPQAAIRAISWRRRLSRPG
jgi:hypothetical protein